MSLLGRPVAGFEANAHSLLPRPNAVFSQSYMDVGFIPSDLHCVRRFLTFFDPTPYEQPKCFQLQWIPD